MSLDRLRRLAARNRSSLGFRFYYSLGKTQYTKSELKLPPGQFNQVVLAQVEELWPWYGQLGEIWFDGGYAPEIKTNLSKL
jgi:hypothetical protein